MLSPDSKSDDTLAKPAQATGTPILDALRKMDSGSQLTDDECRRICQSIFMPATSRKYKWIRSHAGISPDACVSTDTNKDEPRDIADRDRDETDDTGFSEGRNEANDNYCRDPFSDQVFTTAISELWARFSRIDTTDDADDDEFGDDDETEAETDEQDDMSSDADPTLNIWQYALRSALRETDPDARESVAIRYLRTCARNELTKWLNKGRCWSEISKRLRKAISSGGYTVLRDGKVVPKHGISKYDRVVPCGCEDLKPLNNIPPDRLCRGLKFPSPHGGSRHLPSPLPTTTQIGDLLTDFFKTHKASPTVQQLIDTIQYGWNIHDNIEEELSEETFFDDANDRIDKTATLLIKAIEEADDCPIDLPPGDPKAGKLGRLLLQYAIWAGLPCEDTRSGKYGIERYAKLTGYRRATENDRYHKKLAGIFRKLVQDHDLDQRTVIDLTVWLREKYFHRKPETVVFDPLTYGEA